MADLWYYSHDDDKRFGPFSSLQLRDLADAGDILAMDTVWKTGVEQGVPAMRVRHLFPLADAGIVRLAEIFSRVDRFGETNRHRRLLQS